MLTLLAILGRLRRHHVVALLAVLGLAHRDAVTLDGDEDPIVEPGDRLLVLSLATRSSGPSRRRVLRSGAPRHPTG